MSIAKVDPNGNMNATFSIRKLGLADLDQYIRLRREGVRLDPIGFGKAYTTEDKVPRSLYASFLAPSPTRTIWGAFCAETLVGMVRLQGEDGGHSQTIYSLYVCPEWRGRGLGRGLLCRAIHQAARNPLIAAISLSVITKNESALALYHSVGFRKCGIDENTFCVGGEFYSEYQMRKSLPQRQRLVHRNAGDQPTSDSSLAAAIHGVEHRHSLVPCI